MYRRAMLEDVGFFDEEFFAYADDAELGLRGRIAGWRCFYAPAAVVRHHRGATLGLGSARRLVLIERNRVLLVVKLFPWNLIWANGAYHLARIMAGLWGGYMELLGSCATTRERRQTPSGIRADRREEGRNLAHRLSVTDSCGRIRGHLYRAGTELRHPDRARSLFPNLARRRA